jgi:hypothetical protein
LKEVPAVGNHLLKQTVSAAFQLADLLKMCCERRWFKAERSAVIDAMLWVSAASLLFSIPAGPFEQPAIIQRLLLGRKKWGWMEFLSGVMTEPEGARAQGTSAPKNFKALFSMWEGRHTQPDGETLRASTGFVLQKT